MGKYDECFNSYVFDEILEHSECLDIGCWNGNLGYNLISKKNCIVDGIDINGEVLKIAKSRGYRNVYHTDLNKDLVIKTLNKKYDYIIMADVLEHLVDPSSVLKNVKKLLKNKGIIVVSVPNIGFILQRLLLIFGKFDYNESGGIMDSTHLRFFTKNTILLTIKESGFRIEKFYGYAFVRNRFFILRFLVKIFPNLFALQFLIKIKKLYVYENI